jgi:hypothetical protein
MTDQTKSLNFHFYYFFKWGHHWVNPQPGSDHQKQGTVPGKLGIMVTHRDEQFLALAVFIRRGSWHQPTQSLPCRPFKEIVMAEVS